LLAHHAALAEPGLLGPLPEAAILPDELRAAIVLFCSLLDEKQRRIDSLFVTSPNISKKIQ
jgi:hypothetical protein